MPLVSQEPIQDQTGEEASPSQVATQAGSPAVSEPSGEGEPEGVARALESALEPETPQTADSVTTILYENKEEVERLAVEGGGLLGEEAPPKLPPKMSISPERARSASPTAPWATYRTPPPSRRGPSTTPSTAMTRSRSTSPERTSIWIWTRYVSITCMNFHGFLSRTIHPALSHTNAPLSFVTEPWTVADGLP